MIKCIITILFTSCACIAQHEIINKAIYPKVAIAIYRHESGNGNSKLARQHNNVYGFKGGKRQVGRTPSKYSIYKNKDDSAMDYLDFEKELVEKYKLNTKEKYLKFLSRRYAYDKLWLRKIKQLI